MVIMALLAIHQFGAAYRALNMPEALAAQVSLIPPLEFVGAVTWGLILSLVTWRIAWHKSRNLRSSVFALVAFIVYSVARLFVFTRADYDVNRLRFLLVVTILILVIGLVYWVRPRAQPTEKMYERESQN